MQQKGTTDCTVVFSESDWKTSEQLAYSNDTTVSVYAKRDPFVTAIRLDTLSISFGDLGSKTVDSTTYSNIWNNYQLSSIQVSLLEYPGISFVDETRLSYIVIGRQIEYNSNHVGI